MQRLGLQFDLGSDSDQKVIDAFKVKNPQTQELALHAVYIVNREREIFYRKVARRRPVSAELIDAIDAYNGTYPQKDRVRGRPQRNVAFPSNNFQVLIEMAESEHLPPAVTPASIEPVLASIINGAEGDATLIAFRRFVTSNEEYSLADLLTTANWLMRQRFIADKPKAIAAGLNLNKRLKRVRELEAMQDVSSGVDERDQLLHQLAAARGGLSKARATVNNNATKWQLKYAQGSLRGYREVAHEGAR